MIQILHEREAGFRISQCFLKCVPQALIIPHQKCLTNQVLCPGKPVKRDSRPPLGAHRGHAGAVGRITLPQYVRVLTPRTWECHLKWRRDFTEKLRIEMRGHRDCLDGP